MSKLMWIAGILMIAAGIALGVMVFVSTASIIAWGIDLHIATELVIGGILALGLGSVISGMAAIQTAQDAMSYQPAMVEPSTTIPEFGRRTAEVAEQAAAPVAAAATIAAAEAIEVSAPVQETIQALEQARQKIEQAFDAKPEPAVVAPATPLPEPAVHSEAVAPIEEIEEAGTAEDEAASDVAGEAQLYVVEERLIRARPARILSDGTVEAETEEGWMRFENLEHLDEYLDAMSPPA